MNQVTVAAPKIMFRRDPVRPHDAALFSGKLLVLGALLGGGTFLALDGSVLLSGVGVLVLAAAYTHAVELQHQCLHHSAFRRSWGCTT